MKKIAIGIFSLAGGIFLSVQAYGQDPGTFFSAPIIDFNPQFFVAILSGVLIALGIQMVLTNLSVAAGITAIGNVQDMANTQGSQQVKTGSAADKNEKSSVNVGVKIMSAAGAWGMITAAISLFFASLFAVKLSLIPDNAIGVTLGLTIWAVFFMVMLYLESKAIGSILSGVFSSAVSAVKAGFAGVGSLFRKSDAAKQESIAAHIIDKIKKEVYDVAADIDLKDRLDEYLEKLHPQELDLDKFKDEMAELINDISVEEHNGKFPGEKEFFLHVAEKEPRFSKKDISKLSKFYDTVKSSLKVAGAVGGIGTAASLLTQTLPGQKFREEVEEYLKRTGEPEWQTDVLKAELDEIFNDPSRAMDIIKNKARAFDKDTVVSMVAAKQGVSREEALQVADKVEEAINSVKAKVNANKEHLSNKLKEFKDKTVDSIQSKKDEVLTTMEQRLRNFFDKIHRPELDYSVLKREFEAILHNPKLAPDILKMKLKQFDRNTFVGLLASSDRYNKADAERLVHKFEEARNNVINKIDRAEEEVAFRVEQAKQYALEQAENTRKTAVAASWWLFATFVISGIAAMIGGAIAL